MSTEPRVLIGLDTFSLAATRWSPFEFLEFAARTGFNNVEFRPNHAGDVRDATHLSSLRSYATKLGLGIELSIASIDRFSSGFQSDQPSAVDQLKAIIEAAQVVGAPIVRCFMGSERDRDGPVPIEEHIAECVRVLREVAPEAEAGGVTIAVQNHRMVDLLAWEMASLIEAVGSPAVGVCYDTGNSTFVAEDPMLAVEALGPHIVSAHLRDTRVWPSSDGAWAQWVSLGEGNVNLGEVVAHIRAVAPGAALNLELLSGYAPYKVDYLNTTSMLWKYFPLMRASDFARYVRLVSLGTASEVAEFELPQLGAKLDPDAEAHLMERRKRDLQSSVRWLVDRIGADASD